MNVLLDGKSHFSIKQVYGSPAYLVENAKKLGYTSLGLTDYNSISGCIEFSSECKKQGLKPILGCTFSIQNEGTVTVLAKNLYGWKSLIKLVSLSYTKGFFDEVNERPYISLEKLKEFGADLIFLIGVPGDIVHNRIFSRSCVHKTRLEIINEITLDPLEALKDVYNSISPLTCYVGLSSNSNDYTNWFNEVARDSDLPSVIVGNSHYPFVEDHLYLKLLICSKLKSTMNRWEKNAEENQPGLLKFKENCWSIPTNSHISAIFTEDEIKRTEELGNSIEEYNVLSPPKLPKFSTPNGQTPNEYLTELCREGWRKLINGTSKVDSPEKQKVYVDRVKYELGVIEEANLSSYFLIVADFIKFIYDNGWRTSPSRGSAGGCLISYLIGITKIDPIEYGLIFERFYSSARKGSMPDIDVDMPPEHREAVINYIRNKYGKDKVGHLVTYAQMKGATAIKEVLRINDVCGYEIMNEITKAIPEEGKIMDEMEATGEDSILLFTLKYKPDKLKDWVRFEQDTVVGDYARWFSEAIKLEGTISSTGKHASAIVIYESPLAEVCPMINDKSGEEPLIGYEMKACEKVGCVKLDCLGLTSISKILMINDILNERSSHYKNLVL